MGERRVRFGFGRAARTDGATLNGKAPGIASQQLSPQDVAVRYAPVKIELNGHSQGGAYALSRNGVERAPQRVPALDVLAQRPSVRGKFLFVGDEKLYVRGVTYGTFRPREDGCEFPEPAVVESDFVMMAAHGINALRTYSVPPRWLLDAAWRHGLRVLVGLPMERYIGYLADRGKKDTPDLNELVHAGVSSCAGHPAVLAYSIGNEIPTSIVRWHGARRVERYLEELYRTAKQADPDGLVTYANYPSTEYLDLSFLDFACFNVYLEQPERLEAYLARLQCLVGDIPLVMGEIGLDAARNGELAQRDSLTSQIGTTFTAGCAGAFVYAWTDEWHRGGEDVYDWGFGLTRRERTPKPALAAVRRAFALAPFPALLAWPRISVVVCTYNGGRTIGECLAHLERIDYPDYEVIVVNDGSTDGAGTIASRYRCRVISTANEGLSNARNTGMRAATGSIVAYIDDDAYPDVHWLRYLALTFLRTDYAGVGGPNLPPPSDGWIADCVAHSPGNPVHVLLSDTEAEHIPGCNMAFRKAALEAIGGFDPQFRTAGDDVDVCWRLTDAGFKLGFSAAAMVWHHRRGSLRTYWKQQRGYGRAEGMLEVKWPSRHDKDGHAGWTGRIYGSGAVPALAWGRPRIYQGVWGSAPFQSLYEPATGQWAWFTRSPLWYVVTAALALLSLLGMQWAPLRLAMAPLVVGVGVPLLQARRHAARQRFVTPTSTVWEALRLRLVTAALYLVQPAARLSARLAFRLEKQHVQRTGGRASIRPHTTATWCEQWEDPVARLSRLESGLRAERGLVRRGGDFDQWDLEVRSGPFGAVRLQVAVEEHGRGCQLVRVRSTPHGRRGLLLTFFFAALALPAFVDGAAIAAGILAVCASFFAVRTITAVRHAADTARRALALVGLAGNRK
jgi:GT2 family glycosyltransferase